MSAARWAHQQRQSQLPVPDWLAGGLPPLDLGRSPVHILQVIPASGWRAAYLNEDADPETAADEDVLWLDDVVAFALGLDDDDHQTVIGLGVEDTYVGRIRDGTTHEDSLFAYVGPSPSSLAGALARARDELRHRRAKASAVSE